MVKSASLLRLPMERLNIVCGTPFDQRLLPLFLEELKTSGFIPEPKFCILELLLEQLFLTFLTLLDRKESFMPSNFLTDPVVILSM